MQYSLNNYVIVYDEDGPAPVADEYAEWFTEGLEYGPERDPLGGLPGDAPGQDLDEALDDLLETFPDAGLPDRFWAGQAHDPLDELPDDWSDYFQGGSGNDAGNDADAGADSGVDRGSDRGSARGSGSGNAFQNNSSKRPVSALPAGKAATPSVAPPAMYDDDEAFVEFDLTVPVHGLTLRQAIAAVARAVGEKRDELEAWGFHSYGDFRRVRPGKVFRWRFLGYKNGLMRYRAQRAMED